MKLIDITNNKYGKLTVLRKDKTGSGGSKWECICECGNVSIHNSSDLRNGRVNSCGCNKTKAVTTHGMSSTNIYRRWQCMISRCHNKSDDGYYLYGARGIKVCESWHKFENFYEDMGDAPKGRSLDRIDNNKDYSPENCRWATYKQQSRNKRNNRLITFNGATKTMMEWGEITGLGWDRLRGRIDKCNWSIEKAMTTKPMKNQYSFGKKSNSK